VPTPNRFRPETKEAFSFCADTLAAYLNIPLQAAQNLLACVYGYADLHELLRALETPGAAGPFEVKDPERDAARCERFAALLPVQLGVDLDPDQAAIAPAVPRLLGLFLTHEKHGAAAQAFFSAALSDGRRGLEFYRGHPPERLRKRLELLGKRYPSLFDQPILERDAAGNWNVVEGLSWRRIRAALRAGRNGLRLPERGQHMTGWLSERAAADNWSGGDGESREYIYRALETGRDQHLSEELIIEWIRCFREKEGRWPTLDDKVVWNKYPDGMFEVVGNLNWSRIKDALIFRSRVDPSITLERFMMMHGLCESPSPQEK
jgi:hypothetical protein